MQFPGALNLGRGAATASLPLPPSPAPVRCRTRRTLLRTRGSEARSTGLGTAAAAADHPDLTLASGCGGSPGGLLPVLSEKRQAATVEEITPAAAAVKHEHSSAAEGHSNVPAGLAESLLVSTAPTQSPPVGLVLGDDKPEEVKVPPPSRSKGHQPNNEGELLPDYIKKEAITTNTIANGIGLLKMGGRCTRTRCQSRPNTRQHTAPCRCSLLVLGCRGRRRSSRGRGHSRNIICDVKMEFPTHANIVPLVPASSSGLLEYSGERTCTPPGHEDVKKLERETNVTKQCLVTRGRVGKRQCAADDTTGQGPPPQKQHDLVLSATQLVTTGFTNIIDVHPKPVWVAASERPVRRSVKPPPCGLCGVCGYQSKQVLEGKSSPHPKRNFKKTHSESNNCNEKIKVWLRTYPKVALCDLSRRFNVQRDCGYKLPAVLRRKTVRCFQRDLKPRVSLKPTTFTSAECRKRPSNPCKLTDTLTHSQIKCPRHCTTMDHTCHSLETGKGELELPANCSASPSLGEMETKVQCETRIEESSHRSSHMSFSDEETDSASEHPPDSTPSNTSECLSPLPNCDALTLASGRECSLPKSADAPETGCALIEEMRQAESDYVVTEVKKIKLLDCDNNGILPSRPDLEMFEQVMADNVSGEEMGSGIGCRDTPVEKYSEQVDGSCFNFDLKESKVSQGSHASANCRERSSNPHQQTDPPIEHSTRHCTALDSMETGNGELESTACCSASLSLGEMELKVQGETGIVDKHIEADPKADCASQAESDPIMTEQVMVLNGVCRELMESVMSADSKSCLDSGIGCKDTSDTTVEMYMEQVEAGCSFMVEERQRESSYKSSHISFSVEETNPALEHPPKSTATSNSDLSDAGKSSLTSFQEPQGNREDVCIGSILLNISKCLSPLPNSNDFTLASGKECSLPNSEDAPETGCALVAEKRQAESDLIVTDRQSTKRIKLLGGGTNGILPSLTDLERSCSNEQLMVDTVGRAGMDSVMSVESQSCLDSVIRCSDTSDRPVEEYIEQGDSSCLHFDSKESDASQGSHTSGNCTKRSSSPHKRTDPEIEQLCATVDPTETGSSELGLIASCSASLSLGEMEPKVPCEPGIVDRHIDNDPEAGSASLAEKSQAESDPIVAKQVMVDTLGIEVITLGIGCKDTSDSTVEMYMEQMEAGCSLMVEKRHKESSYKSSHISFSVEEMNSALEHHPESTSTSNSGLSDAGKSILTSFQDRQENREDVCKESVLLNISKCLSPLPNSNDFTLAIGKECSLPNSEDAPETGCAPLAEKSQAESDPVVAEQVMVDTVGRKVITSGIGCRDTSYMTVEMYREQVEAGCSLIGEERQAECSYKSSRISFSVEEMNPSSEHPPESTTTSNPDISDSCKSSLISFKDQQENAGDACKESVLLNISKCLSPIPNTDDLTLASGMECSLPNSEDALELGCTLISEKRQAESKIKLLDGDNNGILPSSPDLESVMFVDGQSCFNSVMGCSGTSDTPVEKLEEQVDSSLKESDVSPKSSQMSETNETAQPELLSCQRTRGYFRQERCSCARAYLHWPFVRMRHPPAREVISGPVTSQQLCHKGEDGEREEEATNTREDGGEDTAAGKEVNNDTNHFPHSLGTLEPLANSPTGMTILSSPSHVYTHSSIPHPPLANSADMVTVNTPPIVYPSDLLFHDEEMVRSSSSQSSKSSTPSGKECSLLNNTKEQVCTHHLACAADDDEDNSTADNSNQENEKLSCSDGGTTQCCGDNLWTSPPKMAVLDEDKPEVEPAEESNTSGLDEFIAYENDILLVDVAQDDPDLFGNLPQKSLLKLGPTKNRVLGAGNCPSGAAKQSCSLVKVEMSSVRFDPRLRRHIPDEEDPKRCWKTSCSNTRSQVQGSSWFPTEERNHATDVLDDNNNHLENDDPEGDPLPGVPLRVTEPVGTWQGPTDLRLQLQIQKRYCRFYFSENNCNFNNNCRFPHVPFSGEEKFCVDAVKMFMNYQTQRCLQKAGAVFSSYYSTNPVGVYFSMPVLSDLLWALLNSGLVADVFAVINAMETQNVMPDQNFLQALPTYVTEKGSAFISQVPQLTPKMVNAGQVQNLECIEFAGSSLSTPRAQPLTHPFMEVERCAKQEDWKQLGVSFKSLCQSSQVTSELERISAIISRALLSETKDRTALPFVTFAETACDDESDDLNMIKVLIGRIGVSLLFRYHKTGQWAQGKSVVEVLSKFKIKYSMLKGLLEDGASRCDLVTMATEVFLKSESVAGGLSVLQDNEWFLTSSSWPCELSDLDKRRNVLVCLAKLASYRDALEIYSNLPGLKEHIGDMDASQYGTLLNSHLQLCMNKQALLVAADTALFMLSKNLGIDTALLQTLLIKLGKTMRWDSARRVFKSSLSVGYYADVSAPPGHLQLTVPCSLEQEELALVFEMFITVNATAVLNLEDTPVLRITLKRTHQCDQEYFSAGNRVFSAAGIPTPGLRLTPVHATELVGSNDQVFILDTQKARMWLRQNLWAKDLWTRS